MNKLRTTIAFLATGVVLSGLAAVTNAQTGRTQLKKEHHEVEDQAFVPAPLESMPVSQPYRISINGFTSVQVNVNDSNQNIVGDAANEPSIAIDPTDPSRMAIGWRQFNTISSNFRQAGYGYTANGGLTWTFPGVIEPGIFRSDPVLGSDADGNFYYNSLTVSGPDFWCDVFKSSTGGAAWDSGTFAQGGDKQWMHIDKTGGMGQHYIYAYWTSSYSICTPGFFTRSTNRGASYESCSIIPEDPFWGTLTTGPDGELYVGGVGFVDFVVAKSTTARDSDLVVSWDTTVTVELDGDPGFGGPNPSGLLGQTWIATDHSGGPYDGNVYLLCSVARQSNSDPLDVMFARSTDGGLTWSAPVRVNDDASQTNWQWFGTMSVSPTGRIDVIWLDTRDNPGTYLSSLYYSYSLDGGDTWYPNVRLSQSFNPHLGWPQQQKMGDYFDMVSDSAGAHLAWTATFGGEQNVYYGRITLPIVGVANQGSPAGFDLAQNHPNPFNPSTTITYRLPADGRVSLKVYNLLGQEVRTLVSGRQAAGTHSAGWDGKDNLGKAVASGVYLFRLEAGGMVKSRKMMLLK
jgi:hypothetical protein